VPPSPTPLATKLGLRDGHRLALVHAPRGWSVPDLPDGVRVARRRPARANVVVAFFGRSADLRAEVEALSAVVAPGGALWLAWPRRAGGHVSDLTDGVVREAAIGVGLVDVKVAALDEDWSALRFVWRQSRRSPRPD
jgi:hypothetical protein